MTQIEQLLSIASDPLAPELTGDSAWLQRHPHGGDLLAMLKRKNGFLAFESALHVLPHAPAGFPGMSLENWNSDSLWRKEYSGAAVGLLFFAEDVFQDQFCLSSDEIFRFKAETGEKEFLASALEGWAGLILRDYDFQTGWSLASKWQAKNGPLPQGQRLMPTTPFFLGGKYSTENLWAGDAVEGMRFKADIFAQTRRLPEGTQIKLVIGAKPQNP